MTHAFFIKDSNGKRHLFLRKSTVEEDRKLAYFKRKILEALKASARRERAISKSLTYMEKGGARAAVGDKRKWKDNHWYRKMPDKTWKRIYDSDQERGAQMTYKRLQHAIERCTSSEELMHLVLKNKGRFSDVSGAPLPIVDELRNDINKKNDELEEQTGALLRNAKWHAENMNKDPPKKAKRVYNKTEVENGKEKDDSDNQQGGVPERDGDLRQGGGDSSGADGGETGRSNDTDGTGLGTNQSGGGSSDGETSSGVRPQLGVPGLGDAQTDVSTTVTEKPQEAEETEAEKHANRSAAMMGNKNAYKGIMDEDQFDAKYNSAFDTEELALWRMMTADNTIIAADITDKALLDYLKNSGKFIETADGVWESVVNYASGNVAQKLDALDEDAFGYTQKRALLEKTLPPKKTLDHIHLSPLEKWVQSYQTSEGNLVDKFNDWLASDAVLDSELPIEITKADVVDYIYGKPVKVNAKAYDGDKATAQMVANTIRRERMETAEMLFNKFIFEGLNKDDADTLRDYCYVRDCYVKPDYNKIPVTVDGMNTHKGEKEFTLTSQQINGVTRLTDEGRGLLAYDVGVGKTVTGIAATVKQLQMGRCKRPLICVPKAVYKNWIESIHEHFPNQPVVELGNLSKDYYKGDAIPEGAITVCTYQALSKMNIDVTGVVPNDEIGGECDGLYTTMRDSADGYSIKNLGFDHITIDEVHNFKNIFSSTKGGADKKGNANEFSKIKGSTSARAVKMLALTQYIQNTHGGKNVFALSATPFTNSPTEIYSILSLVARDRLKAMGINTLYDFVARYAELKTEMTVKSDNSVKEEQVVKSFHNLENLQSLITEYIDKVDGDEAGVIRPHKVTHTPELEMTAVQKQMYAEERQKLEHPSKDDPAGTLKAINRMRAIALSPALADDKLLNKFVECSPKLKFVCDSIIAQWKDNPKNGQVIYMPQGVEHFDKVAEYLVKHGMPKDAIGLMAGGASTEKALDKRQALMEDFNNIDGKCKVIIGSGTIQEGVSLNGNATTIYNCMLGWNPSETQQVEGRIWRQGNAQGVTHVVYPLVADSVDAFMYQKYDEKQTRIDDLWKAKGDNLNVEDIDYEEAKYALIKDPKARADMMIAQDKKRIETAIRTNTAQADRLHNDAGIAFGDVEDFVKDEKEYWSAQYAIDDYKGNAYIQAQQRLKDVQTALGNLNHLDQSKEYTYYDIIDKVRQSTSNPYRVDLPFQYDPHPLSYYRDSLKNDEKDLTGKVSDIERKGKNAVKIIATCKRNAQAKIDRMKDKLARQGMKSKADVDKKIDALTKERAKHAKELSGLKAKRAKYEADAKKQLAVERKKLPSLAELTKRNVQSIESQLRPMGEVAEWIKDGRASGKTNAELKADLDKRVGVKKSWADAERIAKSLESHLVIYRNHFYIVRGARGR